jgi:heat shock protein HslJ/membrane-bound inhibitor of C-type lysozyme
MLRTGCLAVAATALAACGTPPAPAASAGAAPLTTVYNCGGRRAVVVTTPQTARVEIDNRAIDMKLVPSASGARYEASEAGTSFWNKGERATISLRGRDLPECVQAKIALPLRATGNEPFWRLDVGAESLTLNTDLGARRVVTGAPSASRVGDATVFSARAAGGEAVSASVVDRLCNDTMTGMPHPYVVTVTDGAKTLRGCGGDPATLLRAREWSVEDVDGGGLIDRSRVTLAFDDAGRVSGSAGCNNFAGRYTLSGEGLKFGDLALTRKACAASLMEQESRFVAALGAAQRFEITPQGALRLLGGDKRSILAR